MNHATQRSSAGSHGLTEVRAASGRPVARLLSLLLGLAATAGTVCGQVHDVPEIKQDTKTNCGPTAAASCLKWFQENNYPNLKTRSDSNKIGDMKSQLEKDAKTGSKGTKARNLAKAMNHFVNGPRKNPGVYKGQLRAQLAIDSQRHSFKFLDDEFANNENLILMLRFYHPSRGRQGHFVTVRNFTGTGDEPGDTRTLEYMDPATGKIESTEVKRCGSNGRDLKLTYKKDNEKYNARITQIIKMSPTNHVRSGFVPLDPNDPSAGMGITYTVYFPFHRVTKALHIQVMDPNENNYEVNGLPAGWQWDVHTVSNKCYLSMYQDSSTNDLTSGQEIEVIYTGPKKVVYARRVITHTTSGTDSPTDGALPAEDGVAVVDDAIEPPESSPGEPACAVTTSDPNSITVSLTWVAANELNILQYEIYDFFTNELIAVTPDTEIVLEDLESGTTHTFVVAGRTTDDLVTPDSPEIMVHQDRDWAAPIAAGGPQTIEYRTPLASCYLCDESYGWTIDIPGAAQDGALYVTTITADPVQPLPTELGPKHEDMFYLWSDAGIQAGPIDVTVSYDENEVIGDEASVRLFALIGAVWTDVTVGIDTQADVLYGQLPSLGVTLAIVNEAIAPFWAGLDCPAGTDVSSDTAASGYFYPAYTFGIGPRFFDNYVASGPVTKLGWYGYDATGSADCDFPNPAPFIVRFYGGAQPPGGAPDMDDILYETTVWAYVSETDYQMMEYGTLKYWSSLLPEDPNAPPSSGWFSVQSDQTLLRDEECIFWSWEGVNDGYNWFWGGSGLEQVGTGLSNPHDNAWCLFTEDQMGYCCDEADGTCTDPVGELECVGPGLIWYAQAVDCSARCVAKEGACCNHVTGECAVMLQANCVNPDEEWLGVYTACDMCCIPPCPPGATLEGEPVCSDDYEDTYNGGCDSDPPIFQPLAVGEVVCGETGLYEYQGEFCRDTDWYEIVVTGIVGIEWYVEGEFCQDYVILGDCAASGMQRGDTNGDGSINSLDIDPFVEALVDPEQYNIDYALLLWQCTADINCDGSMNSLDIDPFVGCLTGCWGFHGCGCPPCPGGECGPVSWLGYPGHPGKCSPEYPAEAIVYPGTYWLMVSAFADDEPAPLCGTGYAAWYELVPAGACIIDVECELRTETDCLALGGTFIEGAECP